MLISNLIHQFSIHQNINSVF